MYSKFALWYEREKIPMRSSIVLRRNDVQQVVARQVALARSKWRCRTATALRFLSDEAEEKLWHYVLLIATVFLLNYIHFIFFVVPLPHIRRTFSIPQPDALLSTLPRLRPHPHHPAFVFLIRVTPSSDSHFARWPPQEDLRPGLNPSFPLRNKCNK
jgi:hypothetical protein